MTWKERRTVTILTTILLVLMAALLVVLGIRFREWRAAAEDGKQDGALTTVTDPDAYTALRYQNGTATLSFIRNEAGNWLWADDQDFPLDDAVIQEILGLLVNWKPQQTLTDSAAVEGAGLDEPVAELTASTAGGASTTVDFGKTTTDGSSYYVRLNGDESTAYIIADTLYQLISTPIYGMCRLPELPALEESRIQSVTLRGPVPEEGEAQITVLTTQQAAEGGAVSWRCDGANVTDDPTVRSLMEDLTALKFARCVDYAPSEEAAEICGFSAPAAEAEIIYTTESGTEAALTLTIGQRLADKSGRYTRLGGGEPIYLLETELLDPLMRVATSGLES